MYLTPHSRIKINNVRFESTNEVSIDRSVKDFENRAIITLPRNFAKRGDKGVTDFIHRGDVVLIELGYGDDYFVEFTGYVDIIGSSTPLIIECDGEWYPHKKNQLVPRVIENSTLKEVLTYIFPKYTIDCPDVNFGDFRVTKTSTFEILKAIKAQSGFYTKINEDKKIVTCYYPFEPIIYNKHTYVFGTHDEDILNGLRARKLFPNIKKNNLKFERKEDVKIAITAKAKQRDGSNISVKVGSTDDHAEKRTRNYGYDITTKEQLKQAAENDLKKMVFDGYTGTIIGFGYPRVDAGDSVTIIDPENRKNKENTDQKEEMAEREGSYLVDKIKINYSVNIGYERVITPSYKI